MTRRPNGRYDAGKDAGKLESDIDHIKGAVDHLTKKVDDWNKWATGVEARLSAGNVRFEQMDDMQTDVEALKKADRGVLAIATAVGGAIGSFAAVVLKFLVPSR